MSNDFSKANKIYELKPGMDTEVIFERGNRHPGE